MYMSSSISYANMRLRTEFCYAHLPSVRLRLATLLLLMSFSYYHGSVESLIVFLIACKTIGPQYNYSVLLKSCRYTSYSPRQGSRIWSCSTIFEKPSNLGTPVWIRYRPMKRVSSKLFAVEGTLASKGIVLELSSYQCFAF
ncbi:hypothetical protein SDJN03_01000, partial [Cucurbita argyrosperma subsp. sororia]